MTTRHVSYGGGSSCLGVVLLGLLVALVLLYVAFCGGVYANVLTRAAVTGWGVLE